VTQGNIHKKAMIEALEKSLGVVTTAAKQVGISRKTHYEWLKDDLEYKQAVEELADVALDFAESQLHKQIQNGEVTSTIFYLKTKGKKRGYVERQEVQNEVSGTLGITKISVVDVDGTSI
jgi:DNA-binding XRE family transcriptional regulator